MSVLKVKPKPVVLLNISGWGIAAPSKGNAISLVETPNFQRLIREYQTWVLEAAGESVGLEVGQAGTMASGHRCLGAGSLIFQEKSRIDQAIKDGSFFKKKALDKLVADLQISGGRLHLIGQISAHKKHSSWDHLRALLQWSRQQNLENIFIQAVVDETENREDLEKVLERTEKEFKNLNSQARWGSISGSNFAMDKSGHWEKTQSVVDMLCQVENNFQRADWRSELVKISEGEMKPRRLAESAELRAGDAVIFFNQRGDGLRQLVKALAAKNFDKFTRPVLLKDIIFSSLTVYGQDLAVAPIFNSEKNNLGLAQIISQNFLKQLHLGDAGSYVHITESFNNSKDILTGEQDILASDEEWLDVLLRAILDGQHDFIAAGFSQVDLAADEDDHDNLLKIIKKVDEFLGILTENILAKGGVLIIVSDHGNAEEFIDLQTGGIKHGNTLNPIPLIIVGDSWRQIVKHDKNNMDLSLIKSQGSLIDVAPTVLKILQIRKPHNMEGRALI